MMISVQEQRLSWSGQVTAWIDVGLEQTAALAPKRAYLGASRLGVPCDRALQYEYAQVPQDPGCGVRGRTLRLFDAGHVFEELAISWWRGAGFTLETQTVSGGQYGFEALGGRLQGHIDGVLMAGPGDQAYPALWECKSMKASAWRDVAKRGVAQARPEYAMQVAVYQAYMAAEIPELAEHPAQWMAINKDTAELYVEALPFDADLAQRGSDRALKVIQASEVYEWLPRLTHDRCHYVCRRCPWQQRCWEVV